MNLEETLLACKLQLQQIREILKSETDLSNFNKREVEVFVRDLRKILEEIESTRDGNQFLHSVDKVLLNIQNVIMELNVSLYILDKLAAGNMIMSDMADGIREIVKSLNFCQHFLDEALEQFLI